MKKLLNSFIILILACVLMIPVNSCATSVNNVTV